MPLIESFSGIRGIYDDSLTSKVAFDYSLSFLNYLKNKFNKNNLSVVIGTDTRPSRNSLKNTIIEALNCNIVDVGIATTPAIEFAVRHYKADGGIIVTASHNEPYWNGFKFLDKDGAVLRPKDIEKVIKIYHDKSFNKYPNLKYKKIIKKYKEIDELYSKFVLNFLSKKDIERIKKSKIKIIMDPNGGTGIKAKKILEKLNVKVIGINMKYGIFNRTVEPKLESLIYLKNHINKKNASFAAAFDCDADRVELVLPSGRLVSGHYLLALITDDILSDKKNTIVVNNATSNIIYHVAKKHNVIVKEVEVGEINVVDEMQKSKSLVGGEGSSSGVIIHPSKCRDGILTLLYILKIISKKQETLQDILKKYPQFFTFATKIEFRSKNYFKIKNHLKKYYSNKGYKILEKNKEASLKILINKESFVWFRASKTEANIFRIIADAPSISEAQKILDEGIKILLKVNGKGKM